MGKVQMGILLPIAALIISMFIAVLILRRRSGLKNHSRIQQYTSIIRGKLLEVGRELRNISFDTRLLLIIICSILIIAFRFSTQWYIVRSMKINIDIWKLSFALLFSVLFSLVPIHGPARFGTVEAPWVVSLALLNIPREDAITSGFGLHIIIIIYCMIMGIFGALGIKGMKAGNRLSVVSDS
jgi:hypothetical protein